MLEPGIWAAVHCVSSITSSGHGVRVTSRVGTWISGSAPRASVENHMRL
jgi:hypothetical protein